MKQTNPAPLPSSRSKRRRSKRQRTTLGCVVALAASCMMYAHGQNGAPPAANGGLPTPTDQLLAPEVETRRAATQTLLLQRAEVVKGLMADLNLLLQEPREKLEVYDGSFLLTLQAIRNWKVSEAIGPLMDFIAFDLGRTRFPVGGRFGTDAYYPVAQTLAELGGPRVPRLIFLRLTRPADDRTVRACTWVLRAVLTQEVAEAQTKRHLERITTVLKNIGGAQTSAEKQNLEQVEALLENDPIILQKPDPL